MRIAIIGAGWAGMAAAVQVTQSGHGATVFEASRAIGGRARAVTEALPDGSQVTLDNGQHILVGAYAETLRLMRQVGVNPDDTLLRLPLTLKFPDGAGLQFADWPAPLDALGGILGAVGWSAADKASLLLAAAGWRLRGFRCDATHTVAQACKRLTPRLMAELIEPLCVSALNTPTTRASGQVFLTVMRDALFGVPGCSDLLLPRVDLSRLFPQAAADWIAENSEPQRDQYGQMVASGQVRLGNRVHTIQPDRRTGLWEVNHEGFDAAILAVSSSEAVRVLADVKIFATPLVANEVAQWVQATNALRFEAITTVYAWGQGAALPHPMLALRSNIKKSAPAQFVFDRGQLGGPAGLLAFVVSASTGERETLQAQVLAQASQQLGLTLQRVQTITEKHATFACTPGLQRPAAQISRGLLACGDYIDGPYPATLEGAVRSGIAAASIATAHAKRPMGNRLRLEGDSEL